MVKKSRIQVDLICTFLENYWTANEKNNFLDLLFRFQKTLESFPEIFKTANSNKRFRLGFIHKNSTAVYYIKKNKVFVVTVFDNRMNDDFR